MASPRTVSIAIHPTLEQTQGGSRLVSQPTRSLATVITRSADRTVDQPYVARGGHASIMNCGRARLTSPDRVTSPGSVRT